MPSPIHTVLSRVLTQRTIEKNRPAKQGFPVLHERDNTLHFQGKLRAHLHAQARQELSLPPLHQLFDTP